MPDEATTAPEQVQETPTDAAVEETTPAEDAPAIDWEQRYNDLRPEFDRNNQLQAAARGQHGEQAQIEALDLLGIPYETAEPEEEDDEWVDPDERFDRLEAQIAQRDEAAEQAQFVREEESWIDQNLTALEGSEGIDLSDAETKIVLDIALSNRHPNGEPDLTGAIAALKDSWNARQASYLASKKAPAPPNGSAGEAKIDFSNAEARQKFMAEDLAARMEES